MVAKSNPEKAAAAQALTAAAREYLVENGQLDKLPSSWKLPCAYGACDRTFDPNGHGPLHHTSCPVGSQFFGMLSKANKAGEAEYGTAIKVAQGFADKLAEQRKAS